MLESRYPVGSGSGSVKGWHAAELAKFKAFDDPGVTVSSKYDIGCKFCGHLAGYHGGEYGKDYKARVAGHWDEECAGYIKSERGDWFLKLLAKGCCIRLAQ
ncbi:hypothetical protein D8674_005042 [Pyrus ussuriensis x Pyrus communis]|uniref:Uncharacterized protein n=1 Tax=Pyrus ussuriensis x Pyrus communis TaxID=2448454 RepID=A0A5N5FQE4_9ROSA|nr:hypothetical protein D8674_005042 [Pyrus ussuriensis x Pyrus communis]